ncbi:MAG: isoprenylcysteine carboxyl methyltransferase family protein [Microvirga sp.]|jgi:methyltransferase
MTLGVAVLALVTLQRLGELLWSRRNAAGLIAAGAVEHGAGHYPALVALHVGWLCGLWLLAWNRQPVWGWLAVYAGLQALRAWVLMTLGRRWTTRIIVPAGSELVRTGPYRFMAHPNYAVVAAEIAILPLAFGLVWYAGLFSILNAAVLAVRVRTENAALASLVDDRAA